MSGVVVWHLSHAYGTMPIVHDVSFSVKRGELACLVGASGCGKSTLLRLIAGLEPVQHGSIMSNDVVIASPEVHVEPQRRNIGLVFQHPSLFPHLTVRSNILFGLKHLHKAEAATICDDMLTLINLKHRADAYPHQLSGGQHQRVALARSLAPKPQAMLLDEPFANLDNMLRRELRDEVIAILKAANMPIIMVTHDPEEALIMADMMILMGEGGVVQQIGSPDSIHNTPKDLAAARFFGHVNAVEGIIKGAVIESSLGALEKALYAPQLADGSRIIVATRPEGIRMARAGEPCVSVAIEHIHHTGAGWLVTARLPEGGSICFHHIYGTRPEVSAPCCVTYEPPHIFIFEQ
jgi:iron(III) transport system ATP-binding protein